MPSRRRSVLVSGSLSLLLALGGTVARAAEGAAAPAAMPAPATAEGPAPPPGYIDRSGISELVAWQAINGLGVGIFLGGAMFAGQVDEHCRTTYGPNMEFSAACNDALGRSGGMTVVGLAAGIALPLLLTRGKPVRTADALLVNRSALVGLMHGFIVPFAAGLEPFRPGRHTYEFNVDEARADAGFAAAGDLAGVGAGTYLAMNYNPTPGTVSFLGTLHSMTFLAGMSVGTSIPEVVTMDDMRAISGISLGLADVALAVGLTFSDQIDIGRNRVFWLDTGSVVGYLAGAGLGSVMAGDSDRGRSIGGTLGMAAGLAGTYILTRGDDLWRSRHDKHAVAGLELSAPGLRVMPERRRDGSTGTQVDLDLLRGTF